MARECAGAGVFTSAFPICALTMLIARANFQYICFKVKAYSYVKLLSPIVCKLMVFINDMGN